MSIDDKVDTPEAKPKTIQEYCIDYPFYIVIEDIIYCQLSYSRSIMCEHHAEIVDHNDMVPCLNPFYQKLKSEEEEYQ